MLTLRVKSEACMCLDVLGFSPELSNKAGKLQRRFTSTPCFPNFMQMTDSLETQRLANSSEMLFTSLVYSCISKCLLDISLLMLSDRF